VITEENLVPGEIIGWRADILLLILDVKVTRYNPAGSLRDVFTVTWLNLFLNEKNTVSMFQEGFSDYFTLRDLLVDGQGNPAKIPA